MTKFEEEVKRPDNGPITELNNNMQEVFSQYRKMRQYADYLEYELNQKDEQLQEKATKLTFAEEEIHELGDKIGQLESQLQQQALPVVPECVGKFVSGDENELSKADRIAYLLKSVQGDSYYLTEELPGDGTITVDEGQELYNWAICQHHETILKLWNGYTVEKSDKCMVKLGALYFKCWNDVDAVFIIDDQPGAYESAFVFKKREDAEKVAQLVGGRVVKN